MKLPYCSCTDTSEDRLLPLSSLTPTGLSGHRLLCDEGSGAGLPAVSIQEDVDLAEVNDLVAHQSDSYLTTFDTESFDIDLDSILTHYGIRLISNRSK